MPTLAQPLKGFRDFLPESKRLRDYVAQKISQTFIRFGFAPLETPTLEYASLLLGKYGDEADKLVYTFKDRGDREVGLRYDQTVPTARVLGNYQHQLPRYFRRYQIQNVFRADKPQHGRFREFTQCDIDIFGSNSIVAESEIITCAYQALISLGFKEVTIKLNHRQSLIAQITPYATTDLSVASIIQTIDKLDKQPPEAITKELVSKGMSQADATRLLADLDQQLLPEQLAKLMELTEAGDVAKKSLVYSPTLARGLDYYTGTIFEFSIPGYTGGSVAGGGRYDNLIADLGGPTTPAVGLAFGFDRLVSIIESSNLIDVAAISSGPQVLVTLFDATTLTTATEIASLIRKADINTLLYPASDKLAKQLQYANQNQIPLVIIAGPDEITKNTVTIKNMQTGGQTTTPIARLIGSITTQLKTKNPT